MGEKSKKMSAEELEAAFAAETQHNNQCSVGKALAEMDDDLREVVQAKIDDNIRYANRVIAKVLKRLDVSIAADTIGKHRSGDCRCK